MDVLEGMSNTGLYAFKETDRKKFDFTCDLVRDWSRLISGQTLWKHSEGIDKDLRILLSDDESKITLYVARDTTSNRRTVHEIISDTKKTPMRERLARLRTVWIPSDFDADKEEDRETVWQLLTERLTRDLLISVILGGVSVRDIEAVGMRGRTPGLSLALIESIASDGFVSVPNLARRLSVSTTMVRNRIQLLAAFGLLDGADSAVITYQPSVKGKVVLDICRSLVMAANSDVGVTPEFQYVLEVLGMRYVREPVPLHWCPSGLPATLAPEEQFKGLVCESRNATNIFGIEWSRPFFERTPPSVP
ncbi:MULTISPECIES: HTH domain-containing protein [unclassified Streptomyces]|uniref:HTH domain-containing protein n=1 Tax=unclassified Streptomyces TaxID=2593676 RepID=UPI00114D1886|nr:MULTISPECIES: HTH domain-containing protein [unclassified Streptomyces]MYT13347.1 HTH domain-containing protein [Streptomyces sp. SID4951]